MINTLHITPIYQYLWVICLLHPDAAHHYHYPALFGVLMELNFKDPYHTMELTFRYPVILVIGKLTLLYLLVKCILNVSQDLL